MSETWKQSLAQFFADRGAALAGRKLGLEELAYVSGRDPRVWTQEVYDDLIADILSRTGANHKSDMLEVGCASGFLARGLAPRVRTYRGLDLAGSALVAARRLKLLNAEFTQGDGEALPFPDSSFDGVICYDVLTNFPSFGPAAQLIREMLRVVRPGGKVLIGSIPDESTRADYEAMLPDVAKNLELEHGPLSERFRALDSDRPPGRRRWFDQLFGRETKPRPRGTIVCYYFDRAKFLSLADGATRCEIFGIHSRNPYVSYRFNAVYTKLRG